MKKTWSIERDCLEMIAEEEERCCKNMDVRMMLD